MENIDFNDLSLTADGRKQILEYLNKQNASGYLKTRDNECWTLYNNTGDNQEFVYLTKIGEYELPAKIRLIPIQRSKANILISQQSKRNTPHKVVLTDRKSINKKIERMFDALLQISHKRVNQVVQSIMARVAELDQQKEMILQQVNQQAETPEQQAKIQNAREALPMLISQYEMVRQEMLKASVIPQKELKKINDFFEQEYEDIIEMYSTKLLRRIKKETNAQRNSVTAFVHNLVTGREYFFVDYFLGDEKITYDVISGQQLIYPNIESVKWVQDGPWVGIESVMTKEQIRKTFNLNSEELKRLKKSNFKATGENSGAFVAGPGQVAILNESGAGGTSSYDVIQEGYNVKRFWWRTDKKIVAIKTPNKFKEGKYFINFVQGKEVISLTDFGYDTKKKVYVNRENPEIVYQKNEVYAYNPAKGETVDVRYFDVRYRGFIIGNDFFKGEIDPIQPRPFDNYKYVPLPVVGRTFSGIGEYPYSMFWSTRELQKQYWIVSYFRELTFALAGASGVVFDISQKPDGMADDYWFYQMKQGRFLIQTLTKTGAPKKTSFNQFQRVDQSLTQSIQYFELILQGLDNQIGLIMGVPPQRMGVVVPSDQVGTFQQSNEQAMLVTEILYEEHDEVEKQALSLAFNIAAQYLYKPGDMIDFPDEVSALWQIPAFMNEIRADVKLESTNEDLQRLKDLKTFAMQETARGQLPAGFISKIITADNLKQLELAIVEQANLQQEIMSLNAQNNAKAAEEARQKTEQLKQSFAAQMKTVDSKLAEAKLQVEMSLKQNELALKERELDLRAQNENIKNVIEAQKVKNEYSIESAMINENHRANVTDEKLTAFEIQVNAMLDKQKNAANGTTPRKAGKEHLKD